MGEEKVTMICPYWDCQKKLRLPKKHAVLRISCPNCQKTFRYEYPFVTEVTGPHESPTKTQKKCQVCYSRIYENSDPTPCVHDEEAVILGSMLARADLVGVARSILKKDDFDIEEHRVIYEAILELFKQGGPSWRDKKPSADSALHKMSVPAKPSLIVHSWLEERGNKTLLSYLTTLEIGCIPGAVFDPESPVSAQDLITYYAYKVKKKAVVRNLHKYRLTSEARDGIQGYLGTIDYGIKQTQTYWLMKQEEESQSPPWYSSLRPELRPTGDRIDTLEALRAKYEIPHKVFMEGLASYPGATRLLQINLYKQAKKKWPNLSEKELLRNIIVGRALRPEPEGYGMTADEFRRVMETINSLKELCDYVVWRESKEPMQHFNVSEWQTYVEMLKKAGVGTDIDWERHRRNTERMRIDNMRANIYGIMEKEARVAMAEVEGGAGTKSENKKEHPQDGTMQQEMRRDSEWRLIEGEPCRVVDFTPLARVENRKVIAPNMTTPYASIILECRKMPGVIRGWVCHKIDFANLWAAFKERDISDNEEVIIIWTTKNYKYKPAKFLSFFYPRMWVMICPKGALEIMVDSNWKPELTGEARWNAIEPIVEWKPEIME